LPLNLSGVLHMTAVVSSRVTGEIATPDCFACGCAAGFIHCESGMKRNIKNAELS